MVLVVTRGEDEQSIVIVKTSEHMILEKKPPQLPTHHTPAAKKKEKASRQLPRARRYLRACRASPVGARDSSALFRGRCTGVVQVLLENVRGGLLGDRGFSIVIRSEIDDLLGNLVEEQVNTDRATTLM